MFGSSSFSSSSILHHNSTKNATLSPDHSIKIKHRPNSGLVLIKPTSNELDNSFKHKYNLKDLKEKWNRKIALNFSFYDTKFPKECVKERIMKNKEENRLKTTPDILELRKKEWNASVLVKQTRFDLFSNKSIFDLEGYMSEKNSLNSCRKKLKDVINDRAIGEYKMRSNYKHSSLQKPMITQTDFLNQLYGTNYNGIFPKECLKKNDSDNNKEKESKEAQRVHLHQRRGTRSSTMPVIKKDEIKNKRISLILIIPPSYRISKSNSNDNKINQLTVNNNHCVKEKKSHSTNKQSFSDKKIKMKVKIKRPPKPILIPKRNKEKPKENAITHEKVVDYWRKKSKFQKEIKDTLFNMRHIVTYYHPGIYVIYILMTDYLYYLL